MSTSPNSPAITSALLSLGEGLLPGLAADAGTSAAPGVHHIKRDDMAYVAEVKANMPNVVKRAAE